MLRAERKATSVSSKKAFFGVQHAPHLILLFPLKLMERNIVSFVKRKACLHSEFSMSTTIERLLTWGGPLSMLAACAFAWLVRSGRSRCGSVGHVQQHTICVQLKVMETNDILSRWFQWIWNLFSCSWLPHFPLYKSYQLSRFKVCSCTRFDRRVIVTLALNMLCHRGSLSATPANSELVFCKSGAVMHPYPLVVRWSATWHCTDSCPSVFEGV